MTKNKWGATSPKEVARCILDELGVCRPYILDFDNNNAVYLFDNGEARRVDLNSVLGRKLRAIEKKSNVTVYAVIHSNIPLVGDNYAFLCVSPYPEDFAYSFKRNGNRIVVAYSYVWNTTHDELSEFGSVALNSVFGKLRRVG
ncbi:MAG: hypothetical protein K2O39_02510 [Clostridiales bacterium]|nr:hypothetical protein [Clostridiales bacterium]